MPVPHFFQDGVDAVFFDVHDKQVRHWGRRNDQEVVAECGFGGPGPRRKCVVLVVRRGP